MVHNRNLRLHIRQCSHMQVSQASPHLPGTSAPGGTPALRLPLQRTYSAVPYSFLTTIPYSFLRPSHGPMTCSRRPSKTVVKCQRTWRRRGSYMQAVASERRCVPFACRRRDSSTLATRRRSLSAKRRLSLPTASQPCVHATLAPNARSSNSDTLAPPTHYMPHVLTLWLRLSRSRIHFRACRKGAQMLCAIMI